MCDNDCTETACGDGVVNVTAGEACDGDGMGSRGESAVCNADCTAAVEWPCTVYNGVIEIPASPLGTSGERYL